MMQIKTITLWQPWASLVVHGYKRWETRSWRTPYRGWLAIHAAKREPDDVPREYDHIEAFCLMEYRCDDCGFAETYWNSRDGVTPFGRRCPECSGMNMLHHDWRKDVRAPDHVPEPGQGVWVDMPESLKRPLALARLRSAEGTDFEVAPEDREATIDAVVASFREGEPWLARWRGGSKEDTKADNG